MAPTSVRQSFLWSLPTIAFLLSFLWYKRKRCALRSDPGGTNKVENTDMERVVEDSGESLSNFFAKERASLEKENSENFTSGSECVLQDIACVKVAEVQEAVKQVVPEVPEALKEPTSEAAKELVPEVEKEMAPQVVKKVAPEGKKEPEVMKETSPEVVKEREPEVMEESAPEAMKELAPEATKELLPEVTRELIPEVTRESIPEVTREFVPKVTKEFVPEVTKELVSEAVKELVPEGAREMAPESVKEVAPEVVKKLVPEVTKETALEVVKDVAPEAVKELALEAAQAVSEKNSVIQIDSVIVADTDHSTISEGGELINKLISGDSSCSLTAVDKINKVQSSCAEANSDIVVKTKVVVPEVAQVSILYEKGLEENQGDQEDQGACSGDRRDLTDVRPAGVERDSANHSPADVMLASPSMSSYSDIQSEGSSDSGKGCSYVATPPSRTPASGSSVSGDIPVHSVYEFVMPQHLVGRLIGRHGCFVQLIKAKTNASIFIKKHPKTAKLKICAVEGTQLDIDGALAMVRQKFPAKRYPNVNLEQVSFLPPVPTFPLIPECLQLQLVEGVNNDVILSSLISPAHFFLQQPTHPTFPALNRLNACMNLCYSEPTAPQVPSVDAGIICAAPTMGGWYRAQVMSVETNTDTCDVKFIDYGGYLTVENSMLRQIRSDFMTLPFQAAECYLANINPIGGPSSTWSDEAIAGMETLTQGQVLQAQVCGYAEDGLPVVFLFAIHGPRVVPINQELVAQGLAEWWEFAPEA